MTTRNPWLGLASYDVPKGMEEDYLFCGRDEETMDIVRLIDNNLFVTLYGSSGIGKTSLLKAGVIPILKRKDYYPLYVRLSQESNEISYAEAIVRHLKNCGLTEESQVALEHADGDDRLFLWNYFATTRFFNAEGREIYPVIILDQFEEVFRDGDKAKAELLLQQIYLLLNDELEMADAEGYSADTNYRFVASIREDYLFVLEDSIDELSLDLYKSNRYRLRPMKPENARQVVLAPGRDCIEESEKEKVAERVLELAKKPQSDDIDTLLLSLVCAGTFDKKAGEKIIFGDLSIWKDNPMQVYYQDAMKALNSDQIRYVQQHLIREDGSRKRVSVETLKNVLGENDFQELTKGKNRLFSIGDKGQVELLHDKLAMAVYEERKAFEERERKIKLRRRVSIIGVLVLAIAGMFFFQNARLKQQRWKMLENQSKLVAKEVISIDKDDSYLAKLIAIEILPKNVSHPIDRPYTTEAELALRTTWEHNSTILKGHTNGVNSCSFSPDGKLIESTSYGDSTLRIWDAETSKEIRQIKNHDIGSATFSPDWSFFVSFCDSTIIIWDTETCSELKAIKDSANVRNPKFSPDGKRIMFNYSDYKKSKNCIKIYDLENDKTAITLTNYSYANYSPDGKYLVAIPDKEIPGDIHSSYNIENKIPDSFLTPHDFKLIDASTGEELRVFSGQKYKITSAAFSPDSKRIVSTSKDRTILIWDAATGKILLTIKDKCPSVADACFSPDGKSILSEFYFDNVFMLWDAVSGEEIKTFQGHTNNVVSVAFSPDGKRIISASRDMTLRVWDNPTSEHSVIKNNVISAAVSPNGESIAYISNDSTIHILNSSTLSETQKIQVKANNYYEWNPFMLGYDGKRVIYTLGNNFQLQGTADNRGAMFLGENNSLMIWNSESGVTVQIPIDDIGWVYSTNFSPNGENFVSTSFDHRVRIWNTSNNEENEEIKNTIFRHSFSSVFASFSPDGKQIAISTFFDSNIIIIDIETEETIRTLYGHSAQVNFTTFNPNSDLLISASADKTLRVWDYETGTCIKILEGHTAGVNHASFSPNGKLIASASNDKTIRVWDVESGSCIHIIEGHTDAVRWVSFTPDGHHIISYSQDSTIRKWPFPPLQELIDQTRERFKDRPLTPEERRMYYLE